MPENNYEEGVTLEAIVADGSTKKIVIPIGWLLENDCTKIIRLSPEIFVVLVNRDELLSLYTSSKVDITLSGELQMLGLQVDTKGQFRINNDMPQEFHEGAIVKANKIVLDEMLESATFISLITPNETGSFVQINKAIGSKSLYVSSRGLNVNALVDVERASFEDCKVRVSESGKLMLGRPARPPGISSPELFINWRRGLGLTNLVYLGPDSNLNLSEFTSHGLCHLQNTKLTSTTRASFFGAGNTKLLGAKIYSKDFYIAPTAVVKAEDSEVHFTDKMRIDGTCQVNRLKVVANTTELNGLITGEELNASTAPYSFANRTFFIRTAILAFVMRVKSAINNFVSSCSMLMQYILRYSRSAMANNETANAINGVNERTRSQNNVEITAETPVVAEQVNQGAELTWIRRTVRESSVIEPAGQQRNVVLATARLSMDG